MLCLMRILRGTGPQLSLVTALGSSAYSVWLRKKIKEEGISLIESSTPGEPGIYGIPPDRTQQLPFSYWRACSAAHRFFQTAAFEQFNQLIPPAEVLVVSGITLALCSAESFEGLVRWVNLHRDTCQVVFDINYRAALWASEPEARNRIGEFEKLASVIATGVEDESKLWHMRSPEAIMERLKECVAEIVVRAGKEGCWVGSRSQWHHAPATPVTVVDAAGAGDAHLAGYMGARIKGCTVLEAASFANSVASVIVRHPGSAPTNDAVFPEFPHTPTTGRSVQ
jgi:2-dehydro-3-deoxygluconokinase